MNRTQMAGVVMGAQLVVCAWPVHAAMDTAPPVVTITAPSATSPSSFNGFVFAGTAQDASGIARVSIYVYDEARGTYGQYTISNAAASYTASTGVWSFAVPATAITPGGFARLWVQATDTAGNTSLWQLLRVGIASSTPPDTQPPVVTITAPSATSAVPVTGFTFQGTATDATSVAAVRVYVFDEVRNSYTVINQLATYTPSTTTWSFAVPAAAITAGGFIRLWVQASDPAGNTSAWQLLLVRVAGGVETLGASQAIVLGTKLYVSTRRRDGTLAPIKQFKLRGVAYSPVDAGETVNNLADARRHVRESRYVEDFPLMHQLGANAIKTYSDFGTDAVATQILNAAYDQGLFVMVTLIDLTPSEVINVVNAYRDHPALLGWLIGNEWNLNRFYDPQRYPTLLDAARAVEQTAQLIHLLDTSHPVASSLGFAGTDYNLGPDIAQGPLPSLMRTAPSVDIWGFNVYRAGSFEPFFSEWNTLRAATGFRGPMLFTEFGTDDWNQVLNHLDEQTQLDTDVALWDEIHRHLSGNLPNPPCVGGFVYSWNDEWWKAGNPSAQGTGGFPLQQVIAQAVTHLPIATFLGHPDGFSNEEHYGLVDMTRQTKRVFAGLQRMFSLGVLLKTVVPLEATSVGNGTQGDMVWKKRGQPVYVGQRPGFYLGVMSRTTGTLESIRRFDTATDPQNQCPALLAAVRALTRGDVALTAISQNGLPSGLSMTASVMAPCVDALQQLGAQRTLQIGFQQPWALISVAGVPGMNLAEGSGTATQSVTITASVFLDADRDGIEDPSDPDNDNDGVPDATEFINGTDVLDAWS